jgi:ParB family chromosome partitioning protein
MAKDQFPNMIKLPPADDLFSTQEERDEVKYGKIVPLKIDELHDFPNHPYSVKDDEDMEKLVESIKGYGVRYPITVRPRGEGGYEIISGHRRKHACELAGIQEIQAIVRELDDDMAIIQMVDSNAYRSSVSPIEKGNAYKMRMAAEERKRGRPSKNNSCQIGTNYSQGRSDMAVAEKSPDSARTIQRYIRLTELVPELQVMVDDKKLKMNPAVELSYLTPDEQTLFHEYIASQERTPSLSQAQQLKAASQEHRLTEDILEKIMESHAPSVKPQEMRVSISYSQLEKYFPKNFTTEQIAAQIIKLLEAQYRHRQHGMER